MNNNLGFYISNLQVTGLNSKPAKLAFEKGFNVISGLSDTGKSYIFACINFMLGGGDCPKEIPEGIGYTDIYLEIKTYSGNTFTLNRNIKGGHFKIKEVEIEKYQTQGIAKEIKGQHTSNTDDNISSFLLGLCGFAEMYVKKNKNNVKRELSFRDIANLTLIDEVRILTEKSPVYVSGQYTFQIQEQSILEILLTGKDAKELEQVEEAKIYHSRIKGKLEFVDSLIKELTDKIIVLEKENTVEKKQLLQSKIDKLSLVLQDSSLKLATLTEEKQGLYNSISELDSKNILHNELSSRFVLLLEHYNSDIKRLAFITEGEDYFSQLTTIKCPLCDGDMDKDHYDCIIEDGKKSSSVIESIEKEIEKIKIKLADLESTLKQLSSDKSERDSSLAALRRQYKIVEIEILTNIGPVKSSTKQEIDFLIRELSLVKEHDLLKEQLTNYYSQKSLLDNELSKKPKIGEQSDGIKYTVLQGLCDTIKTILTEWKYPNIATVNFNSEYKVYDFKINTKNRNAHGKGIRAITYSAFTIGLMDYCIKNNLPHSRNIIIDSPLTTYHGKEQGSSSEDVSKDMQDAFFNDLSDTNHDRQIIILDNKDPREELKAKINYIHFTNDKERGRQGFFPL
ncbi:MAG: AAA family ATPase [Bacteroidetes bacterium]|nr:AAA family ATPase [Bacteroidota bacterium]